VQVTRMKLLIMQFPPINAFCEQNGESVMVRVSVYGLVIHVGSSHDVVSIDRKIGEYESEGMGLPNFRCRIGICLESLRKTAIAGVMADIRPEYKSNSLSLEPTCTVICKPLPGSRNVLLDMRIS
jgi:hypothetical protein